MFTHPRDITIWKDGQNILAIPKINRNILHLKNIRDFDHGNGDKEAIQRYFDDDYDINKLTSCTLSSISFGKTGLYSHLIFSFHFEDGQNLALSVEARRRPSEGFSVLKGFLPYYGLIYIWGTEHDLLGLRLYARKDTVYRYTLTFNPNICQKIFRECIMRTEKLGSHPEIYGSVFNNCTTNIIKHCTDSLNMKYPHFDYRVILSGKIEGFLQKMGWLKEGKKIDEHEILS